MTAIKSKKSQKIPLNRYKATASAKLARAFRKAVTNIIELLMNRVGAEISGRRSN